MIIAQNWKPIGGQFWTPIDSRPTSALILDESSFPKQGDRSVGVARQWTGRLSKVDNCQVAVFGVLTDGERHAPVDMRLYLPDRWIEDPARCEQARVPEAARQKTSKSEHALDIVRRARARGLARLSQCAPMARITNGGRFHPDNWSVGLVAGKRRGWVTGWVEALRQRPPWGG